MTVLNSFTSSSSTDLEHPPENAEDTPRLIKVEPGDYNLFGEWLQSHIARNPLPAPGPEQLAQEAREADLDRAAYLEAARKHEADLSSFVAKQSQLSGRQAIDDPLTGNQGLTTRALDWVKQYDQAFKPKFRRPETETLYRESVKLKRGQVLEEAAIRQKSEEDAYRQRVLQGNLDLVLNDTLNDLRPEKLKSLDREIEVSWSRPDDAERLAETRDQCYRSIAQKMLDEANLDEADSFLVAHRDKFKSETFKGLEQAINRRESELAVSHQALADILPDLARDEQTSILEKGQSNALLDGLYQTAETHWGLSVEQKNEYQRNRQETEAARQWLDQPEHSFKPFPELLAQADKDFLQAKSTDKQQIETHDLVRESLKKEWQKLNDDPIGYVSSSRDFLINQIMAKNGLDASRSSELTQTKIALGRSLAKKLGMEDRGLVLSGVEADRLRQSLDQAQTPEDRLEMLTATRQQLGRYADRAFRQIDVPAEERLAVRLNSGDSAETRRAASLAFQRLSQNPPEDDHYSWLMMARAAVEAGISPQAQRFLAESIDQHRSQEELEGLRRQ